MLIGYARVSKTDGSQSLDLQRDALRAAGVDEANIYHDLASGHRDDRPGLDSCLRALRNDDVLVVWKLDRLGRNLAHLVNTVQDLSSRGVGLRVLAGQGAQIDTRSTRRSESGTCRRATKPPDPTSMLDATTFDNSSWRMAMPRTTPTLSVVRANRARPTSRCVNLLPQALPADPARASPQPTHGRFSLRDWRPDSAVASTVWRSFVAMIASAFLLSATSSALAEAQELPLLVSSNHRHELPPGNHRYDTVHLGSSAVVVLSGTTRLVVGKLITDGDASVRYEGPYADRASVLFDLVVLDGQDIRGTLSIHGSGATPSPVAPLGPPFSTDREIDEYLANVRAGVGNQGPPGINATPGISIDFSLFQVSNHGARIRLLANGGNGGKGGGGGAGGGHTVTECRGLIPFQKCSTSYRDGVGGQGGPGGAGADAGQIRAYLVADHSTSSSGLASLRALLRHNIYASSRGGSGGSGGNGGAGADHWGPAGDVGRNGASTEPRKIVLSAGAWLSEKGGPYD